VELENELVGVEPYAVVIGVENPGDVRSRRSRAQLSLEGLHMIEASLTSD